MEHQSVELRLQQIENLFREVLIPSSGSSGSTFLEDSTELARDGDASSIHPRLDELEAGLKMLTSSATDPRIRHFLLERIGGSQPIASVPPIPLTCAATSRGFATFQPSPALLHTCWSTFVRNVDPLIKILHLPTTQNIFQRASEDLQSLSDGKSALIFAVIAFSLASMPDITVETEFKMSRSTTVATFVGAAEHALSKSNLLVTEDLTTLQAFVMLLSMRRFCQDARQVWALTGLARRLGRGSTSSTLFEQEMHRRLLWELWNLDHRACVDHGEDVATTHVTMVPHGPSNLRDKDLCLSMKEIPLPYKGWTEISFSLIQREVAQASLQIDTEGDFQQKEEAIDACERKIRSVYLQYCDGSDPIHWLAQHVSEVLILELRFKLYGARGSAQVANAASRDKLFLAAVAVLDIPRRLEAEPMAVHWSWLLKAYMQFLPLRFVLDELCYRPRSEVSDHAWTIANMALDRWQEGRVSKANFDICHYLHKQAETARSLSDVDIALPWSICYSSDDFVDATQLMDAVDCCSAIEPLYQR